jgi:hypothetical protein
MTFYRTMLYLGLLVSAGIAAALYADPIPGRFAPERGSYDTSWGPATFSYERGDRRYSGQNGQFTFRDGHIIWGYFERAEGSGPESWVFVGRWVAVQDSGGNIPRTLNRAQKCSTKMGRVPHTITPPDSYHWGSIRIGFTGEGKTFRGDVVYCREGAYSDLPPDGSPEITGHWVPTEYSVAPGSRTVPVPSFPYDGPCAAVSRNAVARIEPCSLPILRPLRLRLLKDMPKAVDRVIFTPLSDDRDAVRRAIAGNTILPRHPTEREVFQEVRGLKFWRNGDTTEVIPPGSVCRHDFWAISVRDGTGAVHAGNGIVYMECGPGNIEDIRRVEEITPKM